MATHNYKSAMLRMNRFAALFIPLICLLGSQPLYAETDAVLDQIQKAWTRHGAEGYRQVARSFGYSVREEQGQILVPVIVERSLSNRTDFTPRLKLAGARLDSLSRSYARILVPIDRLAHLSKQFPGELLRAPLPAAPVAFGLGSIVSQSTSLTDANGYQVGNLNGAGVRVAVVDLGFSGLTNAINKGELPPANTIIRQDYTGSGLETGTPHGTGVAEHVLDMAPDATLYCIKVNDQVSLQNAADYIRTKNIKIANHSVAWAIASYYDGTGPINGIINSSHDNDGVFWSVAAGNQAQKHWRGGWVDSNGNNTLEFKTNDELMALSGTTATVSVFLNWNQYGVSNKTDLSLHVLDKFGNVAASSTSSQAGKNDPAEAVSFAYDSSKAPYDVKVTRVNGSTTGLDITLFSFSHNFEHYVASSSILDPASAPGAFTVGAVNQSTWLQPTPPIESYSSQGPSTDNRQKPDLVAPDGTNSLTYGASYGTSFSAPTVAGAAALLLQENTGRTASVIASLLRTTATDIGLAGADAVYGHGKLQLPLIDSDGDQLTNKQEIGLGTNALSQDTDADGLSDYAEAITYNTNPLIADSDGDGLTDYFEVITYGTNPLASNRGDLAPRGQPDGVINAGDSVVLSRLAKGSIAPSSAELTLGDLNYNGSLDAGDLVVLMRAIQGLITLP